MSNADGKNSKWLNRLNNNDLTAFDEIYLESKKSVFYAIYLITKSVEDTEDLMQETYLDFLSYYKRLKPDTDVVAFLVTSAKNKALNFYNRNKRRDEFVSKLKSYSYSDDKYFDTGLLATIKNNLSENEYNVFLLHVLGEYSFKEISNITKISIGTLTWMYQEIRKKLKIVLGGMDDEQFKR